MATAQERLRVHSLADVSKPAGMIRFIHRDGLEHFYYTAVNRLTGSRLSAFDSDAPSVDVPIAGVKAIFRDIRAKAKVIESFGDF